MEKENLVLKRARKRLETFIEEGDFDETLFDRAYRLGLQHALDIINQCEVFYKEYDRN